ncbi:MAG: hypothetical protein AAGD96_31005 [Chloroflexota bacterium]
MTPVLIGRWQTRLFLLGIIGTLITIPFAAFAGGLAFEVLAFVTITGLFWDIIYSFIQKFHWDRDWPAVFQFGAGVWEFFILLIAAFGFGVFGPGNPALLFIHYWTVWFITFFISQSLMRILFPRWRFFGGRIF